MLAYVFWHWPEAGVERDVYERALIAFQRSLADTAHARVADVVALRVSARPAGDAGDPAYEDWYLVDDFTALGALNEAAVTGACRSPHDAVARTAGGGAGGVYRLRAGRPEFDESRRAHWFSKPVGWSYDHLRHELAPLAGEPGIHLWQRQMVLGPSPEYCLLAPVDVLLPAGIVSRVIEVERLRP